MKRVQSGQKCQRWKIKLFITKPASGERPNMEDGVETVPVKHGLREKTKPSVALESPFIKTPKGLM